MGQGYPELFATPAARITFVDKYAGASLPAAFWPLSLAIVVICQISEGPIPPACSHGRTRLHCCQAHPRPHLHPHPLRRRRRRR